MKKFPRLLALLLALGLLAAACGDSSGDSNAEGTGDSPTSTEAPSTTEAMADSGLPDLGGREVTIAVENAYLPFNYIDAETGEAAGWDYAAIDEMCNRLNCTPVYQTFSWEPMIQAVADGQFDMAADGITITEERAQVVDFSIGYINIDQRIMVRKGDTSITSADDLINGDFKVGTQTGTTNYDKAVELVGQDRVQAFESFPFAVQSLIAGDVDAVIIDETAGQGYLGENADQIELVGESLSSDQLGFIFPKGSDLVEPFNAAIKSMIDDGTMAKLGEEYFSGAFTITYDDIADPTATEGEAEGGDAVAYPDLGGREVTVAVENAYLPFNYIDAETGEAAGWDYAAIDEMCNRLNCTPVYQTFSWEPMIQAVADGQFDMAADGITITEERAQVVDFSIGYINIDQRIMVRKGDTSITSADDLINGDFKVGTQTGTTNYDKAVELVGQDRVQAFESFPFAVQSLIAGDVDAVIIDETAGQGYLGENADQIELVGESLSSDQLGFIFPKGSDLVEPFNAAIKSMIDDGTMAKLGEEYFSGAFTITYDDIADPSTEETDS